MSKSLKEIVEIFSTLYSEKTIGFETFRNHQAIRCKCDRLKVTDITPDQIEKLWSVIDKSVAQYLDIAERKQALDVQIPYRKIVSLSDLHIPFTMFDKIKEILEEHSDADVIVLNGDILDGYVFSQYSKTKRVAAIQEYIAAFNLVKYLSLTFESVVIVSGNHDARASRALSHNGFEKEATQVLRPDLLARIANGEELDMYGQLIEKHNFSNVVYQPFDSWYVRVGKTIFCHPDGFSNSYPGATVVRLLDHFSARLANEDFDSIVVGHTHKQYKGIVSSKLLMEQGAMSHKLPYQFKADLRFKNAVNGYAVIYQDQHGNTDFNLSKNIYLGTFLPIKKEAL
ncbi:Calcineurin-like phosphoesterase domain, ApaH type [uncultured Caudovirales phage]|uniref:Calcineurin-like phosphoesterase domain, ApaH type n=1 Tax=uncultured Caudovirales phage TaxID=2100421 RepID=A0A6J5NMZ0_9CAUD|nr:Calcineurin-like phosphoesterase domain, ApaH type [uncultured Caudovirales phage]